MLCVHNIIPVQLSSQLASVQLYYQSKLLSSLDQNKKNQVFIYNFCTFTFTCLDFNFQRRQMASATPFTHHVQPMGPLIYIGPLLTGNPRSQAGPTVQTRPAMFAHAAIFSSTSACHVCKLTDCTATKPKRATSEEGEISGPGQARLGLALFEG